MCDFCGADPIDTIYVEMPDGEVYRFCDLQCLGAWLIEEMHRDMMSDGWHCEKVGCEYPVPLKNQSGPEQTVDCGWPVEWSVTWEDGVVWFVCAKHMRVIEGADDEPALVEEIQVNRWMVDGHAEVVATIGGGTLCNECNSSTCDHAKRARTVRDSKYVMTCGKEGANDD